MKKFICLFLAALLLLAGCASSGKTEPAATFDGTMEALINKMYENHKDLEMPMMVMTVETTDTDSISFNMGLENGDKLADAAISEPMMGQPYSLILVRAKEGTDPADLAKQMLQNIDTRKWICMEADTKTAAVCGDIAMFFMVNSEFADTVTTSTMEEAFAAAMGSTVTTVG